MDLFEVWFLPKFSPQFDPHTLPRGCPQERTYVEEEFDRVSEPSELSDLCEGATYEHSAIACVCVYFPEARDECGPFLSEGTVGVEVLVSPYVDAVLVVVLEFVLYYIVLLYSEFGFQESFVFPWF